MVSARRVADYLADYVRSYREMYATLIAAIPDGLGLPDVVKSPYLTAPLITCHLAIDGTAIEHRSRQPPPNWAMAGGPAIVVDMEPSLRPKEVTAWRKEAGLSEPDRGLYSAIVEQLPPADIWQGRLPRPDTTARATVEDAQIVVHKYRATLRTIVQHLTFAGIGGANLAWKVAESDSAFWHPHIISGIGFVPGDYSSPGVFFAHLEMAPHVDAAAWDTRTTRTRLRSDLRRDFALAATHTSESAGYMTFGEPEGLEGQFRTLPLADRLRVLREAIEEFAELLRTDTDEAAYHRFVEEHPILLDVYASVESKPRFAWPEGESSPTGKSYVEPDFLLTYPNGRCALVEIERPGKALLTGGGQPRAEVTQAGTQLAEWREYIRDHYKLLRDRWPRINKDEHYILVIGRGSEANLGMERVAVVERLRGVLNADEIWTWDDVLDRARRLLAQLEGLGLGIGPSPTVGPQETPSDSL